MEINGLDCFSGWSESIRRLSRRPPVSQQEGQKEVGGGTQKPAALLLITS